MNALELAQSDVYRTLDGNAHFTFRFVPVDNYLEVDVIYMPLNNDSLQSINLIPSSRGGYRIDIAALYQPHTLAEARTIAGKWAEQAWSIPTLLHAEAN